MTNFVYQILKTHDLVLGRSNFRPAYEPKDDRKSFRNDLRQAVLALRPRPGSRLHATYASDDESFCDLENILAYNFGTAQLHHLCADGFVLERTPANDLPSELGYEVIYSLRAPDEIQSPWRRSQQLASWSFACDRLNSDTKASRIWYACRSGEASRLVPEPVPGTLGIDLILHPRKGMTLRPANVIKPLADGILAAFHGHDRSAVEDLAARLARQIGGGATAERLQTLLTDDSRNVLGSRCLVRPYRETVQWYPEDERLVQIVVRVGEPENDCRCSGTLFSLDREPRAKAAFTVRERLAALASFIPMFERHGFAFGHWWDEPRAAPQYCLSDEALQFYAEVYRFGWILYDFDWSTWDRTPEGQRLTHSVSAIAAADADDLAKLLTLHVRADRFCDGHLAAQFENGHLTAIARRARELLASLKPS